MNRCMSVLAFRGAGATAPRGAHPCVSSIGPSLRPATDPAGRFPANPRPSGVPLNANAIARISLTRLLAGLPHPVTESHDFQEKVQREGGSPGTIRWEDH